VFDADLGFLSDKTRNSFNLNVKGSGREIIDSYRCTTLSLFLISNDVQASLNMEYMDKKQLQE